MVSATTKNAADLERELAWFAAVLEMRLKLYFGNANDLASVFEIEPPNLSGSDSPYGQFLRHYELSFSERIVLLLALIPLVRPQLLDVLWSRNEATDRGFTEFGGVHSATHGGFIPTGETAAFILAGTNLATRFELTRIFEGDHFFARHNILHLSSVSAGESLLSGALTISREYRHLFTTGIEYKPDFNTDFPARLIETQLTWDDLVLPPSTLEHLQEIRHWILHGQRLLKDWEMGRKIQPGFISLFHGPPGTGKTLSACLLGRYCGCDVYRIDLSMIASKYIGETEKNLARIFDHGRVQELDSVFRRGRCLFRQTDAGGGFPRSLRQPGNQLPAPAHRKFPRRRHSHLESQDQHRRRVPAPVSIRDLFSDAQAH